MQQLKPELHRQDGDVGGMIEIELRLAVVKHEGVVDHHEIHVGIAPIDQRVAVQEKRQCKAADDRRQSPAPAKKAQPVEGILRRIGAGFECGSCDGGLVHAGGILAQPPPGSDRQGAVSRANAAKR